MLFATRRVRIAWCGAVAMLFTYAASLAMAGWTIAPRNTMQLAAGPVSGIRELSGVTYLGPQPGGMERFAAIQDENNRFVVFDVSFTANGSISSATAVSATTLAVSADTEGIAYTGPARNTVFISDETGPGVREFNMTTGALLQTVPIPAVFQSIRSNRGFESLSRSLDGTTMWTANEEALTIDGPAATQAAGTTVRLMRLTDDGTSITPGPQFAYVVDPIPAGSNPDRSGLSDLAMLPDDSLLTLERAHVSLFTFRNQIYQVDFPGATDVSSDEYTSGLIGKSYTPVTKKLPALWSGSVGFNMEGLALGPVLANGHWVLLGVSDDDGLGFNMISSFDLSIVGSGVTGDYNGDGKVDDADYRLWKNTFGSTKALAADGDGDGTVDAVDYTIWRDNSSTNAGAGGADGPAPMPEPTAIALLASGGLLIAARWLRRAAANGWLG